MDLREHLLLRMRGEAVYRHAVIVGELDGQHFWVLTPHRFIEKFDFGDKRLNAAKIWDGVTLPASLRRTMVSLAKDSAGGDFKGSEIEWAVTFAASQPSTAAPGSRVKLATVAGVPRRRMSTKGPADLALRRKEVEALLHARIGATDLSAVTPQMLKDLEVAVSEAGAVHVKGKAEKAQEMLRGAVVRAVGWGAPRGVPARPPSPGKEDGDGLDSLDKLAAPDGSMWVINDLADKDFGKSVDLASGSIVLGDKAVARRPDGTFASACLVSVGDMPDSGSECLKKLKGFLGIADAAVLDGDDGRDLRTRLGLGAGKATGNGASASKVADAPDSGPFASSEDCRALWVVVDEHGERFKPWKEVTAECRTVLFSDG